MGGSGRAARPQQRRVAHGSRVAGYRRARYGWVRGTPWLGQGHGMVCSGRGRGITPSRIGEGSFQRHFSPARDHEGTSAGEGVGEGAAQAAPLAAASSVAEIIRAEDACGPAPNTRAGTIRAGTKHAGRHHAGRHMRAGAKGIVWGRYQSRCLAHSMACTSSVLPIASPVQAVLPIVWPVQALSCP